MCKRCGKGVAQDGTEELKRCRDAVRSEKAALKLEAVQKWSYGHGVV